MYLYKEKKSDMWYRMTISKLENFMIYLYDSFRFYNNQSHFTGMVNGKVLCVAVKMYNMCIIEFSCWKVLCFIWITALQNFDSIETKCVETLFLNPS